MNEHDGRRVLFVTMPWATPLHPSLGIGLLSATLDQAGIANDCLYGNLLLPRFTKTTIYAQHDSQLYDDRSAGMSFVPHLYPDVTDQHIADAVAERHVWNASREGQIDVHPSAMDWKREGNVRRALLMAQTREDVEHGRVCLARCMERIAAGNYDIIGFTLTFETQLVASLALARQIKKRWPERKIVFGGAACASVQGVSTLKSFSSIDVVCLGEGEPLICALVAALRGAGSLEDIPGIAFRSQGQVHVTRHAELLASLDGIPVPNYDPFVEQKAASEWADVPSRLLFETSRGCWWGQKHLCTFCGLNTEALVYRSKSPARVLEEITAFGDRWNIDHGLHAVDNILDTRYFADLIPQLAEMQKRRPVSFFFEIKSNLKLWQLLQLSVAGFTMLQPGIESFSDHILELMDKGATAFQQITFIKWAQQAGIGQHYNILMRNPGETALDYQEMTALLPFIEHLMPPGGVANMQLERFSPYFLRPADFGIRNVRPKALYRKMFPDENIDLDDLVYQFDFDQDELDAPALVAARRELIVALGKWQTHFLPHRLIYFLKDGDVLVVDRRGAQEQRRQLQGIDAELFLYVDRGRTFTAIAKRFPETGETELRAILERLVAWRFVCHDRRKDAYLAVVVRVYRDLAEFLAHYEAELSAADLRREVAKNSPPASRAKRLPLAEVP